MVKAGNSDAILRFVVAMTGAAYIYTCGSAKSTGNTCIQLLGYWHHKGILPVLLAPTTHSRGLTTSSQTRKHSNHCSPGGRSGRQAHRPASLPQPSSHTHHTATHTAFDTESGIRITRHIIALTRRQKPQCSVHIHRGAYTLGVRSAVHWAGK